MIQPTATWTIRPVDKSDPTTWESLPVNKYTLLVDEKYIPEPVVLTNAVKSSDVFTSQSKKLKFEDLQRNFVIDQNIANKKKIEITARCIVVLPDVTVSAKNIFLRAQDGRYNLGKMNYSYMEGWFPRGYSAAEGEFVQGQGSIAIELFRRD